MLGNKTKLKHEVVGNISWSLLPDLVCIDVSECMHDKYVPVLHLKLEKPLKCINVWEDLIKKICKKGT
jgi:alpha-L-fucosidase